MGVVTWSMLAATDVLAAAAVPGGHYVNGLKAIPLLLIVGIWARLLTWADKDAKYSHLPREALNTGMVSGLALAVLLFFVMPNIWVGLLAVLFLFGAEVGVYLGLRNAKVGLADLSTEFSAWLKSFGSGKKKEIAEVHDEVQFIGRTGEFMPTPGAEEADRPAFDVLQQSLIDPLVREAEQVDYAPAAEGYALRYVVDGVPYKSAPIEKGTGALVVSLLKAYAGMDVNDRRKPQAGKVRVSVNGKKHELAIQTAGTREGESMRVLVDPKSRHTRKLDELGMTDEQVKKIRTAIADNAGVVLLAAPKGQGLSTLSYAVLRAHDAFVQHIQTLEREQELDLEGITQNKLPAVPPAGEEAKQTRWLTDQEPDVVWIDKVEDQATARHLIQYAATAGKRIYVGMRAGTTIEALTAWRKLVGDDRAATGHLSMVIAGRVLRKLCGACKVAYTPDPNTLRKLNMSADDVDKLFQARTQPMKNDKGETILCEFCHELRFKGRTGVYEVLVVDDEVRQIVASGGSTNQLKAVFRKQKGKYLQEEALGVVERGDTSVQEVLRVMKPADAPATGSSRAAAAAPVDAA